MIMKLNNLYISVSEELRDDYGRVDTRYTRTWRMALHPDLPDVHTELRAALHLRPYRMVWAEQSSKVESVEDVAEWYGSCLGRDYDGDSDEMSFEEAVAWLQGEVV